jgi:hypothetical protein
MLKRTFQILTILIAMTSLIDAQNVLFLDGNTQISTSNLEVNLMLSNSDIVSGIQTTLKLDKPLLKLDTILILQNNLLFKYYSPDTVTTNIVMLANPGYEFKPGKTVIAKIKFKVLTFNPGDSVVVGFENLLMIAPQVQKLNASAQGIVFKFKEQNENRFELKFNISYSSIVVALNNAEKVKDLKIELRVKEGSIVDFVSPMPRIAGFMKLDYSIQNEILNVNLTSISDNGLEPGNGEIFFITGKFKNASDIEVEKIEVTNSNGNIIKPDFKLIATDIYPTNFKLEQNYPNPFNPATTIKFAIPTETRVQIAVFDITGRLVKVLIDNVLPAGEYLTVWDGTDQNGFKVSSGIYIYRMYADEFVTSKKMMLAK